MPLLAIPRPRPYPIRVALLALVAIALVFGAEAAAMQASKRVAKEAEHATLARTVLTTLKGKTLYSLSGDKGPGEANGEGLKDVGTWHAAAVGSVSSPAPSPEPEPPFPY